MSDETSDILAKGLGSRWKLILFFLLIIAIIIIILFSDNSPIVDQEIIITFKTKVLKTPEEITLGMMGKTFTGEFDALLFVMNKPESEFWMKNCIVPLDVIFIDNGKITKIYHNCPPCKTEECKTYPGKGDLVIEMPGGTCKALNIKTGAKVYFTK